MIDPRLLNILACPICKEKVQEINNELLCDKCRKAYPIREGIPVMLIDEARQIEKN